jgi:outer membrane protein TolC
MNRQKTNSFVVALCIISLTIQNLAAQTEKTFTLSEVFRLAIANSKQLKLAQSGVETSQAATKTIETALLPAIDVSLSGSYIGNVTIMDRNFSNEQTIKMPHFGNNFAIDASQVIFTGGAIRTNIEKAKLEEQVALLNYNRNELDICFLVTGYYLDLYKLKNQREVFLKNMEQTEMLIKQIKSKEAQGMALSNDVTRHELMLQNLKLALIEVDNNSKIINQQLVVTLGLPADTQIIPDPSVLEMDLSAVNKDNLLQLAQSNLPELKSAALNKDIAAKDTRIAKADYYPQIAVVASNHFDGPILIEVPTINSNLNFWYLGIGVKYNLASLYKTDKKMQLANKKQQIAENAEALALEHTQVAVQSAYIRFMESFEKLKVYETSSRLASENYRIINNRYLNEAVLITEMLDASNTKLNADLELVNAKLNVIYNYYKLQREIGTKVVGSR